MAKCKERSVNMAILTPSNNRVFSFGMMRGCIDDATPFFVMIFILRDLIDHEFQDRVRVKVTLGPASNEKAADMIKRTLTAEELSFLEGPITTRANNLPATGSKEIKDNKMDQLAQQLLSIKK